VLSGAFASPPQRESGHAHDQALQALEIREGIGDSEEVRMLKYEHGQRWSAVKWRPCLDIYIRERFRMSSINATDSAHEITTSHIRYAFACGVSYSMRGPDRTCAVNVTPYRTVIPFETNTHTHTHTHTVYAHSPLTHTRTHAPYFTILFCFIHLKRTNAHTTAYHTHERGCQHRYNVRSTSVVCLENGAKFKD